MDKFWGFLGWLVFGLALSLGFAWSVQQLAQWPLLVIAVSGIFGGLLYSMLRDGKIQLPQFNDDNSVNPGLVVDFFAGIAGAVVIFLIIPTNFPDTSINVNNIEGLKFIATAIVGGYAGRSLLAQVVDKLLRQVEEVDLKIQEVTQIDAVMTLVETQIGRGLPDEEIPRLKEAIKTCQDPLRQRVYARTRESRSQASRTQNTSMMRRIISIYEALVESDPKEHRYLGELAFAFIGTEQPNWQTIRQKLKQAIELRGRGDKDKYWQSFLDYELNLIISDCHLIKIEINPAQKEELKQEIVQIRSEASQQEQFRQRLQDELKSNDSLKQCLETEI